MKTDENLKVRGEDFVEHLTTRERESDNRETKRIPEMKAREIQDTSDSNENMKITGKKKRKEKKNKSDMI